MAEEEKKATETETDTDFRNTPAFRAVTKQVEDLRKKLAEKDQAETAAKEAEIRKQAEARGEYETIVKNLQADLERTKKQHERDILDRDIKSELYKAGIQNDVFVRGAVAGFTGTADDISGYIENLKSDESNAMVFASANDQREAGMVPPRSLIPKKGGGNQWAQIAEDLKGSDSAKARAASDAVTKYLSETGTMPPGIGK